MGSGLFGGLEARWRRPVGVLLAATLAGMALLGAPSVAFADGTTATPAITVQETQDGQPVFDPTPGPGNDTGPNNGVVRTNDLVTYSVTMSINDPTAPSQTTFQDATATFAPLPLGFIWNSLPLDCSGPNSKLTGDGVTTPSVLVCDFGTKTSGTTWNFKPAIKVLRTAANGVPLAPTATLSATGMVKTAVGTVAMGTQVAVSQAPKTGISIGPPRFFSTTLVNGVAGYQAHYDVGIHIDSGSDVINGNSYSFTADLSSMPAGSSFMQCVGKGDSLDFPSGGPGAAPLSIPAGSGTWTCTPDPANPTKVHITVTGLDTNPSTCSNQSVQGTLPSGMCFIATQYLKVFIPFTSLSFTGTPVTMWVSNLSATDTLGNPNYGGANDPGTGMTNNDVASSPFLADKQHGWTSSVTRPAPGSGVGIDKGDLLYRDNANGTAVTFTGDSSTYTALNTQPAVRTVGSGPHTGDGFISQTGIYLGETTNSYSAGLADIPAGFTQCMTIDNKNSTVTALNPAMPTRAAFVNQAAYLNTRYNWVVQYGVGGNGGVNAGDGTGWANTAAQQAGTCANADSPVWYTDITKVPGGPGAVTKIRAVTTTAYTIVQQLQDLQAGNGGGSNSTLQVVLQVRATAPAGTIVPNYGWFTNDPSAMSASNPTGTVTNTYNAANATGGLGDRVTVTGVRTSISKSASTQQTLAGKTVSFTLNPATDALSSPTPNQALNLTITDTLPAGESYVPGSSACPGACEPASITPNPDGTTTVVWTLGSPVAGTALPPITYQAVIGALVGDGTSLVNTAVISASNDNSPAQFRTATATVSVVNSASFAVEKSLVNPLTEPGTQKVFNLKFANLSNNTYPSTDFIDWLPFNGDQRTPATSFHGTLTLAGPAVDVAGAQTVTFKYTSFPTAQLNMATDTDPATANPAIVWCDPAQFGTPGCPANFAAATGIRINGGQITAGQSDTVQITENAAGDLNGDVFSNQSTGEIPGLGLPIQSNTATGRTVLASIAGTVWNDTTNKNGLIDAGEPDLAGVTIQLLDSTGKTVATTTTDNTGHYVFPNLVHGTYSVHVVQPAGFTTTLPKQGTDPAVNSHVNYGTNTTDPITLAIGQNDTTENAGFVADQPAITVEKDLNAHHVPDPNSPLLVAAGSSMAVTFKVTNTGNLTLNPVKVTDDTVTNISCPATVLAAGASMTCTGTTPAPAAGGTHTDHATAVGSPRGLDSTQLVDANGTRAADVTAKDEAHAVAADPRISVVKTINNDAASHAAPGALVPNNQPMTITFTVNNTGNVPLTNVGVTDNVIGSAGISCPQTTLAVAESITCTASFPAPAPDVQHTDTATAKGTPPVLPDGTVEPDVTATSQAFARTAAHPAVTVVKTINGDTASHTSPGVGVVADSTMQVSFLVTNTGDVRLDPVTVTDSVITSPISCPVTGLNPGESTTCTATTKAPGVGGNHQDTATATGTAATPAGQPLVDLGTGKPVGTVTGTSDAFAHALTPGIGLVKKINGIIAQDKDHAVLVPAGSKLAITFELTNTGQTNLNQVTLSDDVAAGVTCPATTLAAGASMTCTGTATAPAAGGYHHDTATVTGQPLGPDGTAQGATVNAKAEAFAHTPSPSIAVVKKINNTIAQTPKTAVKVPAGKLMTITFEVTNIGDVTLDPVKVTDDTVPANAITCPASTLAPGAMTVCTATWPAPAPGGLHVDHATATGTPPVFWDGTKEPDVTATDLARAYVDGHPAISLKKSINGEDANTAPGVLVKPGSAMNVTFEVTNTGDVPLGTVTVTDDATTATPLTCPATPTVLAPGATITCTATITAPAAGGQHTDHGTVTAQPLDPAGKPLTDPTTGVTAGPVSATDPANAHAGNPSLAITKTVCADPASNGSTDCASWVPEARFLAGSTAAWKLTVTNTGDTPLAGVTITDKVEPSCQAPANTTLAPGKSITITCTTANVTAAELVNTATATGTPAYPQGVTGTPLTSGPATAKVTAYAPGTPEATLAYTGSIVEKILPWTLGILGAGTLLLLLAARRRKTAAVTDEPAPLDE